jgi:4-hydroxythreonine-4-phosphate dehydrogenase
MTAENRPVIAITMGDASGVGPEVIIKALNSEHIYGICRPVIIGESKALADAMKFSGKTLKLHPVESIDNIQGQYGTIDLLDMHNLNHAEVFSGKVCATCGKAAMEYVEKAAALALEGKVKALVTAPINKEATTLAGCGDIGHLEALARICRAGEYATMLASGNLRVVHLTTHYSLRDACNYVTKERILARLKLTHESFKKWGTGNPRIGVAALNPHGGEGGLFGREEIEQINPAVKETRDMKRDARGPFPADSIYVRAINGEFDVVLAMYHDQGHIAVKVHGFENSISVALGLPFVRTSVDHGTAFDIAGKGIADSRSMEEAIKTAVDLVQGKAFSR